MDVTDVIAGPDGPIFVHSSGAVTFSSGPSIWEDDDEDEDIGDENFCDVLFNGREDQKLPVTSLAESPTPPEFVSGIRIGLFDEKEVVKILGDPWHLDQFPKSFPYLPELYNSSLASINKITEKTKEALNQIYRDLFGLLRLLVLIPYTSGNEFLQNFVHSVLAQIDSRVIALTNTFLSVPPIYLHRVQGDMLHVCVNQILRGIKPGNWEDNFKQRLNSPYDFEILPNEDNPFLLFCRQHYSEAITGKSFHEWVLAVHKKYEETIVNIEGTQMGFELRLLRRLALRNRTITGRFGPFANSGCRGVSFPDFPPGFDPTLYSGPTNDPFAGQYTPRATEDPKKPHGQPPDKKKPKEPKKHPSKEPKKPKEQPPKKEPKKPNEQPPGKEWKKWPSNVPRDPNTDA